MSDRTGGGKESTGKLLFGLALFAVFMTLLGIAVVWALSYGPLG